MNYNVKRFGAALLAVVIFALCYIPTAFCAHGAYLSMSCSGADKNRLFNVEVFAQADNENFAASKMVFTYDASKIEFRGVESDNPDTQVVATTNSGIATIVFLNTKGVDISNNSKLFYLEFKAIDSGTVDISLSCEQAVNSSESDVAIAAVDNLTVSVNGNQVSAKLTKKTVSNKTSSNSSSSNKGNSSSSNQEDSTDFKNNTFNAAYNDNTLLVFLAGAGSILILGGIFGIAYYLGKKSKTEITQNIDDNAKIINDKNEDDLNKK